MRQKYVYQRPYVMEFGNTWGSVVEASNLGARTTVSAEEDESEPDDTRCNGRMALFND